MTEFSVASRHLYCIDDIYSEGVHGFIPLAFDDHHFCTVSTMLHTQLIDFKFRPAPRETMQGPAANATAAAAAGGAGSPSPSPAPSSSSTGSPGASPTPPLPASPPGASPLPSSSTPPSPALASSASSLGHSSGAGSGNYPSLASSATFSYGAGGFGSGGGGGHSSVALSAAPEATTSRPVFPKHTVAQILFPRLLLARTPRNTTPQSIMQLANDYHHLFLGALIQSYNQLARTFETYNRHCVSGLQRGALADKLVVPPLVLPSNVSPNSPPSSVASSMSEQHQPGQAGSEESSAMASGIRSVSRGEASKSAWREESSSGADSSSKVQSRSRRSSLDHAAHEHERHLSAAEEDAQLSARYATPKLFTLAYRMRSQAHCCCAWDDPDRAATMILSDLQSVSQQIFTLWNGFQHMLPLASNQVAAFEQVKWEQACAARWSHFVFRESFQIEDRWRVGPINIAELHGRTVAQLRAAGLAKLWKPLPRIRDCTPSLQPAEQVLVFEERFQNKIVDVAASEAEPTRIAREGIQIIEAHFDGAATSAASISSSSGSSSSNNSKRSGNDRPRSDGASSPTEVSRSSPSLSALSDRRSGHVEEPGLSLEAEESMLNATVFSDSIGMDAAKDVAPDSRESIMGSAAARPVPVHLHGAGAAAPGASAGAPTASSIDFDGVSARVAEASRRRRLASIAQAAAASAAGHSTATAGPGALATRPYEGKHLVVLCHGYQGNSWDMRLLKNHLMALYPHCSFFASTANEGPGQTEGDIGEMGQRLAVELDAHLALECRELGRLSFVCHSLGGVIARAALAEPVLAPYLSKLYSYVSLATPHCGYLLSDNSMLTTGIWFLKKWTKSACLSQLSLTDSEEPGECFLSKLAKKPSLALFTHVYLLAAQADKYAPFHSARIEIHPAAIADRKKGVLFHNMVGALLGQMTDPRIDLRRFDVWFLAKKKNIDSFIGRTAHINFLTETNYMQVLFMINSHLFT